MNLYFLATKKHNVLKGCAIIVCDLLQLSFDGSLLQDPIKRITFLNLFLYYG